MIKFLTARILICALLMGIVITVLTLAAVKKTETITMEAGITCNANAGGKLLWDEIPRQILNFISL
jgi:hypothetical protein